MEGEREAKELNPDERGGPPGDEGGSSDAAAARQAGWLSFWGGRRPRSPEVQLIHQATVREQAYPWPGALMTS